MEEQDSKCLDCGVGIDASTCDIHHVVPVHEDSSLIFDENNVVALCKKCHKGRHSTQGWQGGMYLYGLPVMVDSIVSLGIKDTYDLEINGEFANFLANDVVVHNSRNASSSRAIPVERMIRTIEEDPAIPVHWGANQKGMQAGDELDAVVLSPFNKRALSPEEAWLEFAYLHATKYAQAFADAGYHKQIVNRLTEPFQFANVVVTSTEWDNFFKLRLHPAAQPEIQELAKAMKACMDEYSTPRELDVNEFHLPYVSRFDSNGGIEYTVNGEDAIKQSVARCARVSYRTHDGTPPSLDEDVRLFTVLKDSGHWSPMEHVATPHFNELDEGITHTDVRGRPWSNNFREWIQYRALIDF